MNEDNSSEDTLENSIQNPKHKLNTNKQPIIPQINVLPPF